MLFARLPLLAFAACLVSSSGALAQVKSFAPGFDGWEFTATFEKPGVVNCRATRRAGGREDILAMRTDGTPPYLSVKGEGRKGKWPGSSISVPGKPLEWRVSAEANGGRMWFPLDAGAIDKIAAAGIFQFDLNDTEDWGKVSLGRRAAEAWTQVNRCVFTNRR